MAKIGDKILDAVGVDTKSTNRNFNVQKALDDGATLEDIAEHLMKLPANKNFNIETARADNISMADIVDHLSTIRMPRIKGKVTDTVFPYDPDYSADQNRQQRNAQQPTVSTEDWNAGRNTTNAAVLGYLPEIIAAGKRAVAPPAQAWPPEEEAGYDNFSQENPREFWEPQRRSTFESERDNVKAGQEAWARENPGTNVATTMAGAMAPYMLGGQLVGGLRASGPVVGPAVNALTKAGAPRLANALGATGDFVAGATNLGNISQVAKESTLGWGPRSWGPAAARVASQATGQAVLGAGVEGARNPEHGESRVSNALGGATMGAAFGPLGALSSNIANWARGPIADIETIALGRGLQRGGVELEGKNVRAAIDRSNDNLTSRDQSEQLQRMAAQLLGKDKLSRENHIAVTEEVRDVFKNDVPKLRAEFRNKHLNDMEDALAAGKIAQGSEIAGQEQLGQLRGIIDTIAKDAGAVRDPKTGKWKVENNTYHYGDSVETPPAAWDVPTGATPGPAKQLIGPEAEATSAMPQGQKRIGVVMPEPEVLPSNSTFTGRDIVPRQKTEPWNNENPFTLVPDDVMPVPRGPAQPRTGTDVPGAAGRTLPEEGIYQPSGPGRLVPDEPIPGFNGQGFSEGELALRGKSGLPGKPNEVPKYQEGEVFPPDSKPEAHLRGKESPTVEMQLDDIDVARAIMPGEVHHAHTMYDSALSEIARNGTGNAAGAAQKIRDILETTLANASEPGALARRNIANERYTYIKNLEPLVQEIEQTGRLSNASKKIADALVKEKWWSQKQRSGDNEKLLQDLTRAQRMLGKDKHGSDVATLQALKDLLSSSKVALGSGVVSFGSGALHAATGSLTDPGMAAATALGTGVTALAAGSKAYSQTANKLLARGEMAEGLRPVPGYLKPGVNNPLLNSMQGSAEGFFDRKYPEGKKPLW